MHSGKTLPKRSPEYREDNPTKLLAARGSDLYSWTPRSERRAQELGTSWVYKQRRRTQSQPRSWYYGAHWELTRTAY